MGKIEFPFPVKMGRAVTDLNPTGYVKIFGELWRADASPWKLKKGEEVYVIGLEGLTIRVSPVISCPVCGAKYPLAQAPKRCDVCKFDLSQTVLEAMKKYGLYAKG